MDKLMYEKLCWEFISSIKVNWNVLYQNRLAHIHFQHFNWSFDTNLAEFDRYLRLPQGGIRTPSMRISMNIKSVSKSLVISPHKWNTIREVTWLIMLVALRPLLFATPPFDIFTALWPRLCSQDTRVKAKPDWMVFSSCGVSYMMKPLIRGLLSSIGWSLKHSLLDPLLFAMAVFPPLHMLKLKPLIRQLTPLFQGEHLYLATYINTKMFKIKGGNVFVDHHGRLLFPIPNPTKTTCSDPSN